MDTPNPVYCATLPPRMRGNRPAARRATAAAASIAYILLTSQIFSRPARLDNPGVPESPGCRVTFADLCWEPVLALPERLRGAGLGPRKELAVGVAAVSAGTWIWVTDPFLAAMLVMLVGGATVIWLIKLTRWRRAAQRNESDLEEVLRRIDRRLASGHLTGFPAGSSPPQVVRTRMRPGKGSLFLNRVAVTRADGTRTELVEKGVRRDSQELAFWRSVGRAGLILNGDRYDSLLPIDAVDGRVLSALIFPYLPELNGDRKEMRREFRANAQAIVVALAEFNGRNLVPARLPVARRSSAPRPARAELESKLAVSPESATALLGSWDDAHDAWAAVKDAYERLPLCFCHNDVSGGNTVYADGITRFIDFALAGVGPIGSDLHSVIRWSGKAIDDPVHIARLLNTYLDGIRPFVTVTLEDLRLATWAAFYLRYTDLRLTAAQHETVYRLALRRMTELPGHRDSAQQI